MRHKHADLIHAYAEGAEIEWKWGLDWVPKCHFEWREEENYRVKPTPKPDVVYHCICGIRENASTHSPTFYGLDPKNRDPENNLRLTFDGETGKLKSAEVL